MSDFLTSKAKIKELMIDNLLEYLKNGEFPNNSPNAFVRAYSTVVTCSDEGDNQSGSLFEYYKSILKEYIIDVKERLENYSGEKLITELLKSYEKIKILTYWCVKIFTYLDRFYLKSQSLNTLDFNAIKIFREELYLKIKEKILPEVGKMILDDRNGKTESRENIKGIMKIIDDVDYPEPVLVKENNQFFWIESPNPKSSNKNDHKYAREWFDRFFKRETTNFIAKKANVDIESMSAPEYITSSLRFLEEEDNRMKLYINKVFYIEINNINRTYLITANAGKLANKDTGFEHMFQDKQMEELKNAYLLLRLDQDSLKQLSLKFSPYIRQRGTVLYENKEIMSNPQKIIPELINLKSEMDDLVQNCFKNDNLFIDTKNKAFSHFMSKEIYAKQLANYSDLCMKLLFKGKSNEQIDQDLSEIIGLFKCLQNKLAFQIETNKKMSDRLIKNRTLSMYAERELISRLKQEAGVTYVNKMSEMMSDLEKTKIVIDNYKQGDNHGTPYGIKLDVKVVSQSAWEIPQKVMETPTMPAFMNECLSDFWKFYIKSHNTQKLLWCLGFSKIEIQYLKFGNRKYVSTSTLLQYLLLIELEKHMGEKLSLADFAGIIGCSPQALREEATGLVYNPSFNKLGNPEKGIVKGDWDKTKKEFKDETILSINEEFTNGSLKFNTMPMPLKKNAAQEKQNELEEAQILKKYQDNILQATLTRIMKSRIGVKTPHVWLIDEAAKQIDQFKAQPSQIKENIEKLIEKGIMKRSDNDRTCYEYIA